MRAVLLMAGEPGERAALPNSSLHVHQPLGGFQGQASDILIHAEEMAKTKRRMIRLYAEHCRRSALRCRSESDLPSLDSASQEMVRSRLSRKLMKATPSASNSGRALTRCLSDRANRSSFQTKTASTVR